LGSLTDKHAYRVSGKEGLVFARVGLTMRSGAFRLKVAFSGGRSNQATAV
jgi:hypothetical protein